MDPIIGGSLISGGISFLGGLFGDKKKEKALERANYLNSPTGIRAEAEKAGFNPLVFAGPGTGTGAGYAPQFGNNLAGTAAIMGDAFIANEQNKIAQSQLELENQRLEELVKATTLTPTVGGVYSKTGGSPSSPELAIPAQAGQPEPGRQTSTDVRNSDSTYYLNPRVTDAEAAEARYGDVAQEGFGIANLVSDSWYGTRMTEIVSKHGKAVADKAHQIYGSEPKLSFEQAVQKALASRQGPKKPAVKFPVGSPFIN